MTTNHSKSTQGTAEERNRDGTFKRGWSGGPGRPKRVTERTYLATMSERVTINAWCQIVDRAIGDAIDGCDKSRTWLSRYLMPTPVPGRDLLAEPEDADSRPAHELDDTELAGALYQLVSGRPKRAAPKAEATKKTAKKTTRKRPPKTDE